MMAGNSGGRHGSFALARFRRAVVRGVWRRAGGRTVGNPDVWKRCVRDAQGKVVAFVDRREGEDIRWMRKR
jgi:hypothetical protein